MRVRLLSIGPSNLSLQALSEHVKTLLGCVYVCVFLCKCDSLSCYPGASSLSLVLTLSAGEAFGFEEMGKWG